MSFLNNEDKFNAKIWTKKRGGCPPRLTNSNQKTYKFQVNFKEVSMPGLI